MKSDELSILQKKIRNLPDDLDERKDGHGVDQLNADRAKIIGFFKNFGDELALQLERHMKVEPSRDLIAKIKARAEKYRAKGFKPSKNQWKSDKAYICETITQIEHNYQQDRTQRLDHFKKNARAWIALLSVSALLIPLFSFLINRLSNTIRSKPESEKPFPTTPVGVSMVGYVSLNGKLLKEATVSIDNRPVARTSALGIFSIRLPSDRSGRQLDLRFSDGAGMDTTVMLVSPARDTVVNLDFGSAELLASADTSALVYKKLPLEPRIVLRKYYADLNAVEAELDGIRFHLDFYARRTGKGIVVISFFDDKGNPIKKVVGSRHTNAPLEITSIFTSRSRNFSTRNYYRNLFIPYSSFGPSLDNQKISYTIAIGDVTYEDRTNYWYVRRAWTRKGRLTMPTVH